jgi:hypothetical protein
LTVKRAIKKTARELKEIKLSLGEQAIYESKIKRLEQNELIYSAAIDQAIAGMYSDDGKKQVLHTLTYVNSENKAWTK